LAVARIWGGKTRYNAAHCWTWVDISTVNASYAWKPTTPFSKGLRQSKRIADYELARLRLTIYIFSIQSIHERDIRVLIRTFAPAKYRILSTPIIPVTCRWKK
jgi:hypothetical protein